MIVVFIRQRQGNTRCRRSGNWLLAGLALMVVAVMTGPARVLAVSPTMNDTGNSQSALAVSPAITEQVLTPGAPTRLTLRVTNITRVPLPIKASVKNLTPLEDVLPAGSLAIFDASAWFTADPADFILQPNQTREVTVTILPPPQATPGGHYATVYFQPLVPVEALSPSTAYLNARVGVLAFLIVKGAIVEHASLERLMVPQVRQFGPVNLVVPVSNSGNVHVLPEGTVTIRDFRGRTVARLALPTGIVLPKTTRKYGVNWDNRGRIGYFTAQARLTYGSNNDVLQSPTAGLWVIPWLPLGVVIFGGGFIVWFVMRTRARWAAAWRALRASDTT